MRREWRPSWWKITISVMGALALFMLTVVYEDVKKAAATEQKAEDLRDQVKSDWEFAKNLGSQLTDVLVHMASMEHEQKSAAEKTNHLTDAINGQMSNIDKLQSTVGNLQQQLENLQVKSKGKASLGITQASMTHKSSNVRRHKKRHVKHRKSTGRKKKTAKPSRKEPRLLLAVSTIGREPTQARFWLEWGCPSAI